jgi:hypothetical protein
MTNEPETQSRNIIPPNTTPACESLPDLTRNRFFHGQLLGAHDLQTEQDYFLKLLKMFNRCLDGYGTVCGLEVKPLPKSQDCDPHPGPDPHQPPPAERAIEPAVASCVVIECGLALDCVGNPLVVRQPLPVDLLRDLNEADKKRFTAGEPFYLSICYCVQPLDPVRPVIPDACGAVSECVYSKLRDAVRVVVSSNKPKPDHRCDTCCQPCPGEHSDDKCLLLAAVSWKGGKLHIDNAVRRWLTTFTYEPTTITGISWTHGATYEQEIVEDMLQGDDGLVIEFSKPIRQDTLTPGVVDVFQLAGGDGLHGPQIFVDIATELSPSRTRLTIKQTTEEDFNNGDRLLIVVRGDFLLDECCYPVDANHVGGNVPLIEELIEKDNERKPERPGKTSCPRPPRRYGPWVSGNGTPGGTFESWFYVKEKPRKAKGKAPIQPQAQ